MRDLFVFAAVMLTLPMSFQRPFIGLLMFSWLAYMRPQDLCWGFARNMRLSFFVAFAMIAGWIANERGLRAFARWDFRSVFMTFLLLLVTISYVQAETIDEYTNRFFVEYVKIIVIALFTTGQVDSRERFRVMVGTIAICLGFFGVKGGLISLLHGGAQIDRGPGGMMEDNNDYALALVMNVPLLWYMGLSEGKDWVAKASKVAVLLTVITIVLTHSRGGFLALCATALWIAWRSGQLFRAGSVLLTLGLLFPLLAPQHVIDRLSSINDAEESSRNARLVAWRTAFNMIQDNPWFGVGMRNFQSRFLDYYDGPRAGTTTYVSHNSYLQIWAESGTPAFIVYMALLLSVFVVCRRANQIGRSRPDLRWAIDYARMMEATTVGFMVGGFFLNRGHFDLVYHWFALVTALAAVTAAAQRALPAAAYAPLGGRRISVRRRSGAARPAFAAGGEPDGIATRRPTRWR